MRRWGVPVLALLLACGAERGPGAADGEGGGAGGGPGGGPGAADEGEPPGGEGEGAGPEGDPAGVDGSGGVDGGEQGAGDGGGGAQGGDGGGGEAGGGQDGAADGGDGGGGQDGGDHGGGDPGEVRRADALRPNEGSYIGGDEIVLAGRGLEEVREIKIDGRLSFIVERQDRQVLLRTPWGNPGPAEVTVHFEDELVTLPRTFLFTGPANDGGVADWREAWWNPAPAADEELDDESGLIRMAAVSDGHDLYIAIIGFARQDAAIVGYVDLDPGEGTGVLDMNEINPEASELDAAISNRVKAEGGLGAEWAFGTVGMWSSPLAGAPQAGWRDLSDPANPRWMRGALNAVVNEQTIETSIPLPRAVAGSEIAVCVRIVTADGERLSNETLPPDNPALPHKWSTSYMVQVPER